MEPHIVTARAQVRAAWVTAFGVVVAAIAGGLFVFWRPSDIQVANSEKYQDLLKAKREQDSQVADLRAELQTLRSRTVGMSNQEVAALSAANSKLLGEVQELKSRGDTLTKENAALGADVKDLKNRLRAGVPDHPQSSAAEGRRPGSVQVQAPAVSATQRTSHTLTLSSVVRMPDDTTISMWALRRYAGGLGANFYINGSGTGTLYPGNRVNVRRNGTQECFFEIHALEGVDTVPESTRAKVDYVCRGQ